MSSEDDYDLNEINLDSLDVIDDDYLQSLSDDNDIMEQINIEYTREFSAHSNEIYCLAILSSAGLAVTGSGDDSAIVWYIHDCSIKFICEGHTDSVVSAEFHENGNALLTADMLGKIQFWRVDNGCILCSFTVSETLLWSMWVPHRREVIAGCTDGTIWLINLKNKQTTCLPHVGGTASVAVSCLSSNEIERVVMGYDDGLVAVWEFSDSTYGCDSIRCGARWKFNTEFLHGDGVLSLDWHRNGQLIAAGFQSGVVKLLLFPDKLKNEYLIQAPGDPAVEGVKFVRINNLDLLICAVNSGVLVCFDVTHSTIRYQFNFENCFTKLVVFKDICFVSTACGKVYMMAGLTGHVLRIFQPHSDIITDFSVFSGASGGLNVITCSVDSTSRVIEN